MCSVEQLYKQPERKAKALADYPGDRGALAPATGAAAESASSESSLAESWEEPTKLLEGQEAAERKE